MAVVALNMVASTSNPIGRFLLAENVFRNVAHSRWKRASELPDVSPALKFGAGSDSPKVVAIRKAERIPSTHIKIGSGFRFRAHQTCGYRTMRALENVKCRND
jgi:hypothetical protein